MAQQVEPQEVKLNKLETTKLVHEMTGKYYDSLAQLRREDKGAIWVIGQPPFELYVAMDIPYFQWENVAIRMVNRPGGGQFSKVAEAYGFSSDICSYARISTGNALVGMFDPASAEDPDLLMPKPLHIFCAASCPAMGYWYEFTKRTFPAPVFCLDTPTMYDPDEPGVYKRAMEYLEGQLWNYVRFLEELAGHRMDWDRMKEVMREIKKCAELRREIMDLTKNVPAPMNFFDSLITMAPINALRGRPESLDYFKKLRAEVQYRIDNGISSIPNERHRLYWDHIGIWYKVGELARKFAAHGVAILCAFYTHSILYAEPEYIDPERPIRSIAEGLYLRMGRRGASIKRRADEIVQFVEEYKLDGVIMHSSRTCRPVDIGQPDLIREVQRRTGVPGLFVESDHCDPALYDEAYMNSSFESFFELLDSRGPVRAA